MTDLPEEAARSLARVAATLAAARRRPPAADPAELVAALDTLRRLRAELAAWEPELVTAARDGGLSWAELAPALGVTSRQAAERRYLRLRSAGVDDRRTGEERVRDERARRAGDRAVTAWARSNSGPLRRLAGQIGALEGLPAAGQRRVADVRDALADDDAARLLDPLAGAQDHLRAEHAGLADEVRSVTDRVDRLRRDVSGQHATGPTR